jgi:hypothetical protein
VDDEHTLGQHHDQHGTMSPRLLGLSRKVA